MLLWHTRGGGVLLPLDYRGILLRLENDSRRCLGIRVRRGEVSDVRLV